MADQEDNRPWMFANWTDGHAGSEFAPDPQGSRAQKWLADKQAQAIEIAHEYSKTYRLWHLFGGEFTEKGLRSVSLALKLMKPLMEFGERHTAVRGTGWHTEDGRADTEVALALGIKEEDLSEEMRTTQDGRHIWHTHHGPKPSVNPRTQNNALNQAAVDAYLWAKIQEERVPDVWLYGHWHQPAFGSHEYLDAKNKHHEIKVVCCPPWQVRTRYGFKVIPLAPVSRVGVFFYVPTAHKIVPHTWTVPHKYNRGIVGRDW